MLLYVYECVGQLVKYDKKHASVLFFLPFFVIIVAAVAVVAVFCQRF